MAARANARFPATLALPADTTASTVYLRLKGTVPMRGQIRLQSLDRMAKPVPDAVGCHDGLFRRRLTGRDVRILGRAWRLRSRAYGLYALLGLSIGCDGHVHFGLWRNLAWPASGRLAWAISSTMACVSAGLALLLAECAFALEVRAPRFSLLLRFMGVLCPLAGVLGLAFECRCIKCCRMAPPRPPS
jgi:hypothetical protein